MPDEERSCQTGVVLGPCSQQSKCWKARVPKAREALREAVPYDPEHKAPGWVERSRESLVEITALILSLGLCGLRQATWRLDMLPTHEEL